MARASERHTAPSVKLEHGLDSFARMREIICNGEAPSTPFYSS
jgi:hypothetical protein